MAQTRRTFLKAAALTSGAAALPSAAAEAATQKQIHAATAQNQKAGRLADLVNVLQGTNSTPSFSRGNTLPIVAVPFGMGHWVPQTTSERGPWFFHPADPRVEGIRCSHQLSPWLGDYGHLTVMPFTGEPDLKAGARASSYRPAEMKLTPYSLHMRLMRYRVTVDMAPSERCAIFRFTFADPGRAGLCFSLPGNEGKIHPLTQPGTYLLTSPKNQGGVAKDFAAYYVARIESPDPTLSFQQGDQEGLAALRFNVSAGQTVTLRIACSFISANQAQQNLKREIGDTSIDAVREQAATQWQQQLSRVTLDGATDTQRRIFYSCLYRASLFPRIWHELDASDRLVHRSPYNGKVESGPMYADHGFWDVYRAWYPMMTLLYPERLGEILQGWVNASKEGGWLPQFPCPGYRGAMSGSPADSVIADAAVKHIGGFDLETAYAALYKEAMTQVDHPFGFGRQGVLDYEKLGYLPLERYGGALTETLDAAYGDFCIGQVASVLGRREDAAMFERRSRNWRNVYDPAVSFLRPRMSNGSFPPEFDPVRWGSGYVEGGPWQYRVSVPHDPQGLIQAMGGRERFIAALQELVTMPPRFNVGDYGFEIHEMSEMAAVDFGQYAHSNQPSHHILYMFAEGGRSDLTQHWVRRVLNELYTVEDFCGDEDTGAMAAWYILSSLGLYSLCPGRPEYTLGSPLFPRAVLHHATGAETEIVSANQAPDHAIVGQCSVDGKPLSGSKIEHQMLATGAHVHCTMRPG